MSVMTNTLERICKSKPARSREEVERQLEFFPFKLSNEVYEYYQWGGAPTGDKMPEGWDGSHNGNSTYYCDLEHYLGSSEDLIHFLSLEEAEQHYSWIDTGLHDAKCLPFVGYENGLLVIAGSDSEIEVSAVLQREDIKDKLWFPSLTNMMLAIAESVETIGTIMPGCMVDENGDFPSQDEVRKQWETLKSIARKYGSPRGIIVTN